MPAIQRNGVRTAMFRWVLMRRAPSLRTSRFAFFFTRSTAGIPVVIPGADAIKESGLPEPKYRVFEIAILAGRYRLCRCIGERMRMRNP